MCIQGDFERFQPAEAFIFAYFHPKTYISRSSERKLGILESWMLSMRARVALTAENKAFSF
jgi:hypothetical protein